MQALLLATLLTSVALVAKTALIYVLPVRLDISSTHQHAHNALRDSTQPETMHQIAATVQLDAKFAPIILPTIKSPAVAAPPVMGISTLPAANAHLAKLQQVGNQFAALLAAAPAKEYNV